MTFKTRITEILEEQNLKQADLCRMTGISTALMSNYVTGKASPSLDNAMAIANALGVTLDYLVGHKTDVLSLSKEKAKLISVFDRLNPDGQNLLFRILDSLSLSHAKNSNNDFSVIHTSDTGSNYGMVGGDFNSGIIVK